MVFERFKERMRQGTGLSKDMGHFKGTDNARVEDMLNEADDFATKLKKYEKHLRDASAATTGLLESTSKTLSADLPKVYDRDPDGKAIPQFTQNNAHQSVKLSSIADIVSRREAALKTQVFGPIEQWLVRHKEFSTKLKKLNNFRLDLDNARREHGRAELERVRSQQKHDNVPTEVNNKILEHSTSLQGKREVWGKYESEIHAELTQLISDAANMHVHLAAALRIEADALSSAAASGGGQLGSSGTSGSHAGLGTSGGSGAHAGTHLGSSSTSGAYAPVASGGMAGAPRVSNPQ